MHWVYELLAIHLHQYGNEMYRFMHIMFSVFNKKNVYKNNI